MEKIPVLTTGRLILRPFDMNDAKTVQELAGDEKIAATTLNIPHPYQDGVAEEWIATHQAEFEEKNQVIWAITVKDSGEVVGAIGLMLKMEFDKAEAGYWIGVPYWNNGYASEALSAAIKFGFEEFKLNKIFAHHLAGNEASGKVMTKNGLKKEAVMREEVKKNGEYFDIVLYSILKKEYLGQSK